jgi:tRNA(fMet)-specific endonuclease VapC
MILLDTDHLSLLKYTSNPRCQALTARLATSPDQQIGTTIISVEEQWRGWLAVIARKRDVTQQVKAYRELFSLLDFLDRWTVMPFEDGEAERFKEFRRQGIRIGSMDLKIGCITLGHDAVLLSANVQDFQQIPGLRIENWLD